MAVVYKWFGLVLFSLTCLTVSEARCGGRTVLTDLQGTISDGPSDYPVNTTCEWLINGSYPNVSITITFIEFGTECSIDYLFIYDGGSYLSPLIGAFSGNTLPGTVVAHSGQMLINLYSDTNYTLKGFVANYTIENCTKSCSGKGICVDGFCQCDRLLYRGKACDLDGCPSQCSTNQGRGQCNFTQGHCECNSGYIGESCSLPTHTDADSNKWFTVSSTSSVFSPRIAHSVIYFEKSDILLAFGGYSLNKVYADLLQFNFTTSLWSEVYPESPKPAGRFSHSASLYHDSMVLFGGELQDRSVSNELWLYNISVSKWTELAVNDSFKPPPVAEHTATLVDDVLYIFGGRTTSDHFSSAMYSYSLSSQTGWEKISYKSGNEDHLRMFGHSAVYYADMRSIIIFGGFVPKGARVSDRSNKLLAFHVDLQVWSELAAVTPDSKSVPPGRAFHSAVLVGDYMIIYGGNIHQTCYDNSLFFYHLKCQKWISSDIFQALSPSSSSSQLRGRFSHQVVPRNGSVLLVVGGFSGQPLGDVLGYKLPTAIIADKNSTGGQCGSYINVEKNCKDDPDCGWCSTDSKCFSRAQSGSCDVSLQTGYCPGLCAVFKQCGTCLSFGSTACGWCVQDGSCYPTGSPTGACQTVNNNNIESLRGWWGDSGQFLTSFNQCQSSDHPPGITVVENQMYPLNSIPDNVMIALETEVWVLHPSTVQLIGYIYPYKYLSSPWRDYGMIFSISNFASGKVEVWLSTDDTEANQELVGSCKDPVGGDCLLKHLQRSSNQRLFPSQAEDKRYFIKVIINKTSPQDGGNSHFKLSWNRTSLGSGINTHEILSAQFLQPYSSSDCSEHKSCLACMTNANCGWCVTACRSRNTGSCFDSSGNPKHLTLNQTECTVCSDYVDCSSCNQGSNCVWGASKGLTLGCYQRGQKLTTVHEDCSSPCLSRKTCESCLSDRVGCTWCDKTQSCFVFGTYTSLYPYGQCSHWIDSYRGGQCSNCSQHTNCQSCLTGNRCGWCGNDDDPRIGRCFSGDFVAPYSGQCSNIFPTNGSTVWSYSECPDVNECKLDIAQCHENATCNNSHGSFQCICNRGLTGDGTTACNKTCFHDCGEHGFCDIDYKCKCDLGWLGENCSTDCGCNGHSDCSQGVGICDKCQENTQGNHCEFCIPGSYGNATTSLGCKSCHCNGHGDPKQNVCDMETGKCFCTDFTLGHNCSVCMPGLLGNPENGGICFHECKTRSILTNITQGYISTEEGSGVSVRSKASCLWVISSLSNASHGVIYGPSPPPVGNRAHISLTFKEIRVNCLTDHVDVYDGLPPFLLGPSPLESFQSFRRLGSFCGWNATKLKPVTALLGNMVVVMTANLSTGALSQKFSAKFEVTKCPGLCGGNRKCIVTSDGERCVCLEGWTGANCNQLVCPKNCSVSQGQGNCNLTLGHCVCTSGFIGPDCSQTLTIGTGLWEKVLADLPRPNITVSHVARLGHSMVHGPGYLLVFAGYSTSYGLLDDILSFNITSNTWSVIEINQLPSNVPSARYLHSAVFHGDSMLVYGGQTKDGADQSLWQFNVTTLRWTKMTSHGQNVAGHTATLAEDEMVLIGGYDRVSGFNDKTFKYNVLTKQWSQVQTTGPYPKGLYGHTTVYYATTSVMLVFGGYRFRIDSVMPSDALYSLDLNSRKWSILQPLPLNEPRPKYFHSAAILDGVMIVYGGRSNTTDQLFSSELLLYNIKCNYWYLLPDNSLLGSKPEALVSAAAAKVADRIFIFGGFNGEALGTLFRLTLPSDLCQALTSKEKCNAVNICSWCEVHNVTQEGNLTVATNQSACYSVTSPVPAVCHAEPNVTQVIFHNGTNCSALSTRSCDTFYSCSTCLASYPHPNTKPSCSWCTHCPTGGKCIKSTETCHEAHPCVPTQQKQQQVDLCSFNRCEASSCTTCLDRGQCMWTTHLKWVHERQLVLSPSNYPYSWNCYTSQIDENYKNAISVTTSPLDCPQSCSVHTSCTTCLASNGLFSVAHARLKKLSTFHDAFAERAKEFDPDDASLPRSGGDGGWKECAWSETLGQCFSPSYLPIICLAGQCGRVIRGSTSECMGSCGAHQQCSYCLNSYNCGWCAEQGIAGIGQCFEGGIQGPLNNTCTASSVASNVTHVWASTLCPLENECENGRNNCDPITQLCVDTPEAYRCVCKQGYDDTAEPGTCVPVCSKGCDHGRCVRPEVCACNFGWTSVNCSVKCLCNEHGQCANETHLDVCHDCRNHTVGRSCEFCEPLYVGDATDNGSCVSCYNECNHRADVCMNVSQLEYGQTRNLSFEPAEVKKWLKQGPFKIEREEECLCKNNSNGFRCGSCVYGFFEHDDSCTSCLCNGHADTCQKSTGTCKCGNNTEEDCPPTSADCYKRQCSKCKENFMGSPVNSQQCYRKINVMQEFVIGQQTGDDRNIQALPYGQSIFYGIYPRFTNVDIRLTVDVFTGEVDVYVTSKNDVFTVEYNQTSGHHEVLIKPFAGKRKRRSVDDTSAQDDGVDTVNASDKRLNTFITYNERHQALIVRQVRKRLVLTFPHSQHFLKDDRFYMVFVGRSKPGTKGLVYFRQDLSQIDLFVFFSVFFSAFFLVVSVSVFGWKIKQYHTRRRVIEHREMQLESMRSRPFATYSLLHQKDKPQPSCWRIKRDAAGSKEIRFRDTKERPVLAPVSQEPAVDGRASVTTVVFQLPANECTELQLMFGSALTWVTNQQSIGFVNHHVSNGRKTSTRRTVTFTS